MRPSVCQVRISGLVLTESGERREGKVSMFPYLEKREK